MMSKKSPQLRFEGFTDDWEQRKLKDIVNRVTRKNKNLESTLPLTISAQYGLVDQITFFNKQIASKDMSGYYLLQKGEFAYNKSYSKDFPWGAIKRLNMYDEGVLSTLYIAFLPFKVNSDFLVSYYETDGWHKEVAIRAAEGARNHGLLNITAVDFFDTGLMIPPNNDEQQEIGGFFIELDHTITLHQRKLDLLKEQKKGYLQKMFPKNGAKVPELRFAGFADDWEERKLGQYTKLITKGTTPKDKTGIGDVNFVKVENITNGKIYPINKIKQNEHDNYLKRSRLEEKDILFSIAGTLGRTAIVNKSILPANTNQALAIIRGYDFDTNFLITSLAGNVVKEYIRRNPTVGAQPNLSLEQVGNLLVNTPNAEEQQKIGSFFQQLDETIALHQRKLDLLKEQKKGFLQKMFV